LESGDVAVFRGFLFDKGWIAGEGTQEDAYEIIGIILVASSQHLGAPYPYHQLKEETVISTVAYSVDERQELPVGTAVDERWHRVGVPTHTGQQFQLSHVEVGMPVADVLLTEAQYLEVICKEPVLDLSAISDYVWNKPLVSIEDGTLEADARTSFYWQQGGQTFYQENATITMRSYMPRIRHGSPFFWLNLASTVDEFGDVRRIPFTLTEVIEIPTSGSHDKTAYTPTAIINHNGAAGGFGHYFFYIKMEDDNWYKYDTGRLVAKMNFDELKLEIEKSPLNYRILFNIIGGL